MFKQIGENIRVLRKWNSLSQSDLGEKLNLSRQQIANYESGDKTIPLISIIEMSKIFEISIDFLVSSNLSAYTKPALTDLLKNKEATSSTQIKNIPSLQNNSSALMLDEYFKKIVRDHFEPIEDLLKKVLVKIDLTDLKYELGEEIKKANILIGEKEKDSHS